MIVISKQAFSGHVIKKNDQGETVKSYMFPVKKGANDLTDEQVEAIKPFTSRFGLEFKSEKKATAKATK